MHVKPLRHCAMAIVVIAVACALAPAGSLWPSPAGGAAIAGEAYAYAPLTPWRKPRVVLPQPRLLDYAGLAEEGMTHAGDWKTGSWYCEYLRCKCPNCSHGYYPLATIWGSVALFEAVDALAQSDPTPAHKQLVDRFARQFERYWNPHVRGFAPYPDDRGSGVETWFDDNGWLGIAFLEAFRATKSHAYLSDANKAFEFAVHYGWDASAGGGMWWNTDHPYHSGPALASQSLLGMLLYSEDHESWQLEEVKTFIDWANANDVGDERKLYLEKPNDPNSVNDYVQAPLVYAQYLLCQDGEGQAYCERAGRVAATMSEQDVNHSGYRFNYGPDYDAIYLQWMMAYGQAVGDPYWMELAQVNAAAAEKHAADGAGLWLGSWWGGPIADPETHPEMLRTEGSTTSLFAWLSVYAH
ncbi:MAG: glycoside hydrolase family 76 protein [Solirubrobacteraceae bacterium]